MAIKIQNVTVIDDNKKGSLLSLEIAQNPGGTGASYLKVPYYTSTAARDAALQTPTVGMVCVVNNGLRTEFLGYDGTKWDSIAGPAVEEGLTIAIMGL
jgi:hypothetical protein